MGRTLSDRVEEADAVCECVFLWWLTVWQSEPRCCTYPQLFSSLIRDTWACWFRSEHEMLIVMDYLERGSLAEVLQDSSLQLDAQVKRTMALDAARGMLYLHSLSPPVLHRDLKVDPPEPLTPVSLGFIVRTAQRQARVRDAS